jgi:hypothetical protein
MTLLFEEQSVAFSAVKKPLYGTISFALAPRECCAYVVDRDYHCIRRVPLPEHLFVPNQGRK